MMKLGSILTSKTSKATTSKGFFRNPAGAILLWAVQVMLLLTPGTSIARIDIDINAPGIQKLKIAIPDFIDLSKDERNQQLAVALPGVVSNDLDMAGYFTPMDKASFLDTNNPSLTSDGIRFKDWSVIGADLLLKGAYTCIGQSVEVEVRLFDVFRGQQILGKRILGKVDEHRTLMHRIGNDIFYLLTGQQGMFLSKLAFVGNASGHKEIYVADYDGYNVQQITSDKSIALFPRWSPQADKLFYNSFKEGQGPMLYMRDMATGKTTKVSGRKGLNTGAAFPPHQRYLALTLTEGDNMDIYTIDFAGNIIRRLTSVWGINVSPTFSPDGTKMAYVSNRSGAPQIYVQNVEDGREERITFEGKYNTSPSWSSLNRIAYAGQEDSRFEIFTINPNGSGLRKITGNNGNHGNNEDPCWYANGRYLVFSSSRDGGYHLYLAMANGFNPKKINITVKGEQTCPSWSP
jgi:TolB protein